MCGASAAATTGRQSAMKMIGGFHLLCFQNLKQPSKHIKIITKPIYNFCIRRLQIIYRANYSIQMLQSK